MAKRNIVKDGDEILRKPAKDVTVFDDKLAELLDDMYETMVAAEGVGIAAPQVGIMKRAAVVEVAEGHRIEMINPEIIETSGSCEGKEGCLSFPNVWGIVVRPQKVRVKAQDRFGNPFEFECENFEARAVCHETDHLNGIVFVDKVIRFEETDRESGK